MKLQDLYKRIC